MSVRESMSKIWKESNLPPAIDFDKQTKQMSSSFKSMKHDLKCNFSLHPLSTQLVALNTNWALSEQHWQARTSDNPVERNDIYSFASPN